MSETSGITASGTGDSAKLVENPRWIDEPPLVPIADADFASHAKAFDAAVKTTDKATDNVPTSDKEGSLSFYKQAKEALYISYVARAKMEAVAKGQSSSGLDGEHYSFAYYYAGTPMAMMVASAPSKSTIAVVNKSVHVDYIFANPQTVGGGVTLIEKAVNISEEKNRGGVVTLFAIETAAPVYEHVGFAYIGDRPPTPGGYMVLDPAKPEQPWRRIEGQWRYVKPGGQPTTQWAIGDAPK